MKQHLLYLAFIAFSYNVSLSAQKLLKPFESVSHKKSSFVTTEDGVEIEGTIKKLKRKKGLITEINIKDSEGKSMTIPLKDISHAYLPQSGWDKLMKFDDFVTDATQWDSSLYDQDRIKEGYAYFEKSEVNLKKKTLTVLVQLLNPGISDRVKVYHNPFAAETAGMGIGGIQVSGGKDKSYFVSKDGETAYKLSKKKYDKSFKSLFGDCRSVNKDYGNAKWKEFEKTLFDYNTKCEE